MGGNQSQPNATAIIGTGKGGPLDTSAGTIASRGISFTYDHAAEPALRDITLTVPAGECIVLCGASGCGKTSYTRVANGLIPSFFHGAFAGNQTACGLDVETVPIDRLTPLVGSVFQNPKTQYFNALALGICCIAASSTCRAAKSSASPWRRPPCWGPGSWYWMSRPAISTRTPSRTCAP
jgi:ABC-type molybdenum transport system ATPase subunit/photorepair protein PhrA